MIWFRMDPEILIIRVLCSYLYPCLVYENIIIIGDPSEAKMPDPRLSGLIRDPAETDIPHWRPTCPIGGRHV